MTHLINLYFENLKNVIATSSKNNFSKVPGTFSDEMENRENPRNTKFEKVGNRRPLLAFKFGIRYSVCDRIIIIIILSELAKKHIPYLITCMNCRCFA